MTKQTCPKCGCEFTKRPALSREDNRTLICPECGIREALDALGIDSDSQEAIIAHIHRYEREATIEWDRD